MREKKGKSARIAEKIKKKIGIDVAAQPVEPTKKETVSTIQEDTKTEEKKENTVSQKKTETKTSDKK